MPVNRAAAGVGGATLIVLAGCALAHAMFALDAGALGAAGAMFVPGVFLFGTWYFRTPGLPARVFRRFDEDRLGPEWRTPP